MSFAIYLASVLKSGNAGNKRTVLLPEFCFVIGFISVQRVMAYQVGN